MVLIKFDNKIDFHKTIIPLNIFYKVVSAMSIICDQEVCGSFILIVK